MESEKNLITTHPISDEQILVIRRKTLFKNDYWEGVKAIEFYDSFERAIMENKEFHSRSIMEKNPDYKQIIPYLLFKYQNSYFLMQRKETASEQRLKSKFSLGIGGHIRKEDFLAGNSLFSWALREFNEEVHYKGKLNTKPLAIINDDSNEVGKVHIGFVLLLEGNIPAISIKSELKSGTLVTLEECYEKYDLLEPWSQLLVDFLISKQFP